MVLFSKSTLKIQIHNKKFCYTNSDIISGTLTYEVHDKADLRSIDVQLYGIATSRNYRSRNGQNNVASQSQQHVLIQSVYTVFPPPDIREVSTSQSFSVTEGTYTYPFEIKIPDQKWNVSCLTNPSILHHQGFLRKEKFDSPVNLPPSYSFQGPLDTFAKIEYFVTAVANKSSTFKINTRAREPINFVPKNSALTFSLFHICNKRIMKPDYDTNSCKFPFKLKAHEKKSTFSRILSSSTISIPFEFRLVYKPFLKYHTFQGVSNRVIPTLTPLPSLLDIYVSMPFSYDAILNLTDSTEQLIITSVRISLLACLEYKGQTDVLREDLYPVLESRDIEYLLDLRKLEQVECQGEDLDVKLSSKTADHVNSKVYYRFKLPAELYDTSIPQLCQSFAICNIRKTHKLLVNVTVRSNLNKTTATFGTLSSIVLFNSEAYDSKMPVSGATQTQTQVDQDSGEDLPRYETLPPYDH